MIIASKFEIDILFNFDDSKFGTLIKEILKIDSDF
jgi:hypothetical protein